MDKQFYRKRLSQNAQEVYDYILSCLEQRLPKVYMEGPYEVSDFNQANHALYDDHPELFYVDWDKINKIRSTHSWRKTTFEIDLSYKDEHLIPKYPDYVQEIIQQANIKPNDSDLKKHSKLHNWFVRNVEYDFEAAQSITPERYYQSYNVLGVFLNRKAVCSGISRAYKALADALDLPTIVQYGQVIENRDYATDDHEWNIIQIGGVPTHVDVTYDIGLSQNCRYSRFDYFGLSDFEMSQSRTYNFIIPCSRSPVDYFETKKRLIRGKKSLDRYLDRELARQTKNDKVFYLKVDPKGKSFKEMSDLVYQAIRERFKGHGIKGTAYHERNLFIFFYRVEVTS